MEYNETHGITPTTVRKSKDAIMGQTKVADSKTGAKAYVEPEEQSVVADPVVAYMDKDKLQKLISETQKKMEAAAKDLDFIEAARFRDDLAQLKKLIQEKDK